MRLALVEGPGGREFALRFGKKYYAASALAETLGRQDEVRLLSVNWNPDRRSVTNPADTGVLREDPWSEELLLLRRFEREDRLAFFNVFKVIARKQEELPVGPDHWQKYEAAGFERRRQGFRPGRKGLV